jgi:hypothetical protein
MWEYLTHKRILASRLIWFAPPFDKKAWTYIFVTRIRCFEEIALVQNNCYGLPTIPNFPVVDANFFFNGRIYLLQMTTKKFHNTSGEIIKLY